MTPAFANEAYVRKLTGIDKPTILPDFRERFLTSIFEEVRKAGVAIPEALLERLAFAAIREGFSPLLEKQLPLIQTVLVQLAQTANAQAREGHNNALDKSLAPDVRVSNLSIFDWQIEETDFDLILPDCVALGIETDGNAHPLMMADIDQVMLVLLPLTSRKLMIGKRELDDRFTPSDFNRAAAACSHTYFLAASQTEELTELIGLIGTRSVSIVDAAIGESLQGLRKLEESSIALSGLAEVEPNPALKVSVSYTGDFDPTHMGLINTALSQLLGEVAWTIPLDRLDGITFADDYPAALLALDRGKPGLAPPHTRQDGPATGIAQCPNVIRDGVLKSHVVVLGYVGRALVSEKNEDRVWARAVIADQLAQAGVTQIVDETLPNVLLNRRGNDFETELEIATYPGWNSYFSSRASAGFSDMRLAESQDILLLAVRDAFDEIPKARLAYRLHGNIDQLLAAALPRVAFILEHAANVLGHATGTDEDPLKDAPELEAELKNRELLAWLYDYGRDLAYTWDRRGAWESYDEFTALTRHAERLLWPFFIIPWKTPEGTYRIEVPLQADSEALKEIRSAPAG